MFNSVFSAAPICETESLTVTFNKDGGELRRNVDQNIYRVRMCVLVCVCESGVTVRQRERERRERGMKGKHAVSASVTKPTAAE